MQSAALNELYFAAQAEALHAPNTLAALSSIEGSSSIEPVASGTGSGRISASGNAWSVDSGASGSGAGLAAIGVGSSAPISHICRPPLNG